MSSKRKIEVFSAGCPICNETLKVIQETACPSCEVIELNMKDRPVAARAKTLGIRSVPGVVIDGTLADCCAGHGPDINTLRSAGLGQIIP